MAEDFQNTQIASNLIAAFQQNLQNLGFGEKYVSSVLERLRSSMQGEVVGFGHPIIDLIKTIGRDPKTMLDKEANKEACAEIDKTLSNILKHDDGGLNADAMRQVEYLREGVIDAAIFFADPEGAPDLLEKRDLAKIADREICLLYTSPSPRD